MYITITTNAGTQTAEVANTESGLYEEIGKHLLDLSIPNRMTVTTPVGDAEYDITQRGTYVKDGKTVPSMYVKEMRNTIKLPTDSYPEAYLTCINPASNNYKFYHFIPQGDLLYATYGRIGSERGEMFGVKDLQNPYPIHMYWIRYYEKLSKGYVDSSDIYLAPQYTAKQEVKESQKILKKLSSLKTTAAFNRHLEQLLMISPRKSRHVNELLANTPSDFEKIIDRENDLLTAMEMVSPCAIGSFKGQQIEVYDTTDSQKKEVYEHLIPSLQSKVKHIWRVIPQKQQQLFNDYCEEKHIRYVRQMWHGSRNANWLNITENSLKILPSYEHGRMFGNGAYFALDSMKSFGYTSSSYAKWNQENEASVYMGLFAVAYGKPLFVTSSCQMTAKRLDMEHKNCLHAKAGSSLRADEIVFYDEKAMVMNYLVEFSA